MKTTYDSGFKQECATVGCANFVGLPEGVRVTVSNRTMQINGYIFDKLWKQIDFDRQEPRMAAHCLDTVTVPEFRPNVPTTCLRCL